MTPFKTVGIGELAVSRRGEADLVALGLGSCVAVLVYDNIFMVAGMAHIVLPRSTEQEALSKPPAYFADLAIERLLVEVKARGSRCGQLLVKLVGGARMGANDNFGIGKRNLLAIRRDLLMRRLAPRAEEVGGTLSRTVNFRPTTGAVTISYPDKEDIAI